MIPNHDRFIEAIQTKNKVGVRFYSRADNGVLDRICAPLEYGPGVGSQDGLNRYWLWDYASPTGSSHILGLVPQQIVDLQVLGVSFNPDDITAESALVSGLPTGNLPAATAGPASVAAGLKL